jgi:hypothetical protein
MSRLITSRVNLNSITFSFAISLALGFEPSVSAATGHGQNIFKMVEPAVFKVKTSVSEAAAKASYGTGFAVSQDGLVVTNFHVVSDAVVKPHLNQIYLVDDQQAWPAQILAVDVTQDLAVIKVDQKLSHWLRFAERAPQKGESIFSIGEPEDLNMAIVTGVYNGELQHGPYANIHMSAPVNSGMSGGPTVNSKGEIIGVVVSKLAFSDSVSFSVPARFAKSLIESAKLSPKPNADAVMEDVRKQLVKLQSQLKDRIVESRPASKFGRWMVLGWPTELKCWSDRSEDQDDGLFETLRQRCHLPHSSMIGRLQLGTYSIEYNAITSRKLNRAKFLRLIENELQSSRFRVENYYGGLTAQVCSAAHVVNRSQLAFLVTTCSAAHVKTPELRDTTVLARSLSEPPHGLSLRIEIKGFAPESIIQIMRLILDGVIGTSGETSSEASDDSN